MIIIYTTPTCDYCELCKEWFEKNDIDYEEIDVLSNPEARNLIQEKTGTMAVPVIKIGEEFILGFDEKQIIEALENKPS